MRSVLLLVVLAGCAIDHTGLVVSDDASVDAPTLDAPSIDIVANDVPVSSDGGGDSPAFDAGTDASSRDGGSDATVHDAGRDAGRDGGRDSGPMDAGNDVDPCTVGDDSDGDGVVDACDACPGFNDADDFDSDGIADGCDDWSCGVRPTVPQTVEQEEIQVSGANIHGMGNTAVVRPEERFEIVFDWLVGDAGCPGCIRQLEWGFTRMGRLGCVYDANPPSSGASGQAVISNITIPPMSEGLYELRFNLGQEFSCDDIDDWHGSAPGSGQTFGAVCVPPAGLAFPL